MNNQNNTGIENNKPRLKKVKRPIRKIQPQMQGGNLALPDCKKHIFKP